MNLANGLIWQAQKTVGVLKEKIKLYLIIFCNIFQGKSQKKTNIKRCKYYLIVATCHTSTKLANCEKSHMLNINKQINLSTKHFVRIEKVITFRYCTFCGTEKTIYSCSVMKHINVGYQLLMLNLDVIFNNRKKKLNGAKKQNSSHLQLIDSATKNRKPTNNKVNTFFE